MKGATTAARLGRRGMMGALALLGLAGGQSEGGEAGRRIAGGLMQAVPVPGGGGLSQEEHERRWRIIDALLEGDRRANRRQDIQTILLNGWPPGLDSMHSNARWFRAMAAARRIEAAEEAHRNRERSITERVMKGLLA